jgi:ribosomal protein L37E
MPGAAHVVQKTPVGIFEVRERDIATRRCAGQANSVLCLFCVLCGFSWRPLRFKIWQFGVKVKKLTAKTAKVAQSSQRKPFELSSVAEECPLWFNKY